MGWQNGIESLHANWWVEAGVVDLLGMVSMGFFLPQFGARETIVVGTKV